MTSIPSQQSNLTAADLNAVIDSNTTLVKILEQINTNLAPLKDIKESCGDIDNYVKQDLIKEIVKSVVVDKQLDITNEQSKLALSIAEQTSLLRQIFEKLNKAIWVLILCVMILGGISVVNNWFLNPQKSSTATTATTAINAPVYRFDETGHAYITSRLGDTLWVSPTKPQK